MPGTGPLPPSGAEVEAIGGEALALVIGGGMICGVELQL